MANNKIQIKRSTSNATVPTLANGELAFTQASNTLWIGLPDGSGNAPISGVRYPGTLTANQALVANSTSGIDKVITANLTAQQLYANGSAGSGGYILFSGGATSNLYWLPSSAVSINVDSQYVWTNTQTFSANITFNSNIFANTVNAVSVNSSSFTTTNFSANSTLVSATALNVTNQVNTATLYASTSANIASAVLANSSGLYTTGTVNAASHTVGSAFIANSTGVYSTGAVNAASFNVGSAFIANSTTVAFTGSNVYASSADLTIRNINASGNLVVSGTVVSVNVQTLIVNDNIIELADNNTATDLVDTGWFSPAGDGVKIWYSGLARIANKSSNTNPYFWLFGSNTNPNTGTTIDQSSNSVTATLQSYLVPYGTGGAFVANSTVVNITANSTISAAIVANSLTLSTALAAAYGGTGQSSYSTGDLLYASGSTTLSKLSVPGSAANGQVLQIVNNLPAYDTLDGGTF